MNVKEAESYRDQLILAIDTIQRHVIQPKPAPALLTAYTQLLTALGDLDMRGTRAEIVALELRIKNFEQRLAQVESSLSIRFSPGSHGIAQPRMA